VFSILFDFRILHINMPQLVHWSKAYYLSMLGPEAHLMLLSSFLCSNDVAVEASESAPRFSSATRSSSSYPSHWFLCLTYFCFDLNSTSFVQCIRIRLGSQEFFFLYSIGDKMGTDDWHRKLGLVSGRVENLEPFVDFPIKKIQVFRYQTGMVSVKARISGG